MTAILITVACLCGWVGLCAILFIWLWPENTPKRSWRLPERKRGIRMAGGRV